MPCRLGTRIVVAFERAESIAFGMFDPEEILSRLDLERQSLARDDEAIEILPSVTRLRAQDDSYRCVNWSSLSKDHADLIIRLVAARARDARARGARYLVVNALPQSRANLERL